MDLLGADMKPTEVAKRCGVSRQTVHRYRRAAQQQQRPIPHALPMGGYRTSKLRRSQVMTLSRLALEQPKRTLAE